ncbi:MAG: (d)CMP kinase [Armatimonadota bacterium]
MSSPRPIVAIDGPAGAGKSTITRRLARRLDYVFIDTGAMYRAVALFAQRRGVPFDDPEGLTRLAESLRFEFRPDGESARLFVEGEDVSEAIRTPEVSRGSSQVSVWPGVRAALVAHQRRMGEAGGVVMEGRDIGTVVFPHARVKIYLTATEEERARRRCLELTAKGAAANEAEVLCEVRERDRRDMEREHSPLRKADDAVEVVTDGLTIEQVVDCLEELVRKRERE